LTVTKHEHVRYRILDLLGSLSVGNAIPPERGLSEEFGVSRMTVRRAVDELVREGYLVRHQGSGTFVAEPKIAQQLTMTSFSEDMRRRGLAPSSKTLSMSAMPAGASIGRYLELYPKERILRIARLRLADGETMAIETLYVPEAMVPGLTSKDLEDSSFYELLETRYGILVATGTQTIEPTVIDEEESKILQVPPRSPAFLFERTTRSHEGVAVEFVRSIYRGDRYRITAELRPPLWRPARQPDGRREAGRRG
jgi:GntR family transcriptional regulator